MDILISNLLSESILDFGKWPNWKYTNTHICVFSVWPLPEVKNWFWKQIWNEKVHISILNFFLKSFGQYFNRSKNGFLQKSDLTGVGYILRPKFFLKKPNFPKYAGTAHYAGLLLAALAFGQGRHGLRPIVVWPSAKAVSLSLYHGSKSIPWKEVEPATRAFF